MTWNSRAEYYAEIESDAEEIIKEVGALDHDAFSDATHEWAENAVIYTADQLGILRYSRNRDEYEGVYGNEVHGTLSNLDAQRAYLAYYRDVMDYIDGRDDEEVYELLDMKECDDCYDWQDSSVMTSYIPPGKDVVEAVTLCCDCLEERREEDEEEEDDAG